MRVANLQGNLRDAGLVAECPCGFRAKFDPVAVIFRWDAMNGLTAADAVGQDLCAAYLFAEVHRAATGDECKTGHLQRLRESDMLVDWASGMNRDLLGHADILSLFPEGVHIERNPYADKPVRDDRAKRRAVQAEANLYPETREPREVRGGYTEAAIKYVPCLDCGSLQLYSHISNLPACTSDACRQGIAVESAKMAGDNWDDEEELLCRDAERTFVV